MKDYKKTERMNLTTDRNIKENASPVIIYTGARWLKLLQASTYASIGKHKLKALAKKGVIVGYSDPDSKRGDWIFDRESLDKYRLRQAPQNIEEKILALKAKVRL
ncbi:MAG: hypothetical protein QUS13_15000 [Smithella sp.]|nr:hypothetical protein [Smithella sp.]